MNLMDLALVVDVAAGLLFFFSYAAANKDRFLHAGKDLDHIVKIGCKYI
ncbi:hypothetical protein I5677_07360 [Mobilitalea sibirica]|uniref:Uncharacterized protein n=1 Tax=Mobilitalea sibirica TaxID=1462919 RepID=A0A8J7KSV5_9FIRM|nr:hypothetical protein [Mobilitalea sibirica]MBH1940701.1 hypothetical protein [Mobilitalea sibirica]